MLRSMSLAACAAAVCFAAVRAEDEDPEPTPPLESAIKRLDEAATDPDKHGGREAVDRRRKALVAGLTKRHASLQDRGQEKAARELMDQILLADSLEPGAGLDTKLTVPKLLQKASADRYQGLLHVVYLPSDKAGYTEYRDYGFSNTPNYGNKNGLTAGFWVYVYPRWYVWKEMKP